MLTPEEADAADRAHPEPTPPLGSWRFMYILVLVVQLVLLVLFVLFQNAYA